MAFEIPMQLNKKYYSVFTFPVVEPQRSSITFADIGGNDSTLEVRFVDYMSILLSFLEGTPLKLMNLLDFGPDLPRSKVT